VGTAEAKKQKQRHLVKRVSDDNEELAKVDVEEESDDGDDEELDDDDEQGLDVASDPLQETRLSTHERQQEKIKKRIEQLEKSNLDPKHWTLQGEITAAKRPKNSALEVELDFEHAAQPAPVITEEVTASLEDIIRSRIIEERFDDVQRKAIVGDIAPKARVELDENKSKKGLGEIYEEEYMQSAGLSVAATPVTDSIKAEVTSLFKLLCLKLDALSHFHFAPKPVVEEMEIRSDVPALAMEEVSFLAFASVASCAILYWSFLVHSLLTQLGIKKGILAWSLYIVNPISNLPHVHTTVAVFPLLNLVGT
jgi:U3 small nucleolar RNA-associated protein MPP10